MARKSRRNKNVEAVSNQIIENCENLIDTGAYIRLSVENGGNETDETLVVQQMLVEKFIEEHPDLKLAGTYIDNGFSGTNFERPGFLKLMEDVRSGKIQCIVVKDLSRFGRDYLETGYYLETILPRLNVRFIAITDDYDSSRKEDRENISVPLKNMVNAMYAKDMSKKILAAKDAQRKKGNITLSKVAFGYVRSEDRHRQIVDEEVAPFVRMIFQWYMMGVSKKKIADRLNLMGIATPGQREKTGVLTVPLEQTKWRMDTVDKILNNPTYAGDIVTGKLKQSLYKGIKQYKTSPEDWNVQRDMHTPMIARDDYEELQERSNKIRKVTRNWHLKYMEDREKYKDCFRYVSEPGRFMNEDILEYQGTYYTLSDTKMPFKADKTVDDDYFILTLYALAMEARNKGITLTGKDVVLGVGLPPADYGQQATSFKKYFLDHAKHGITFKMNGKSVNFYLKDVFVSPQNFAAVMCFKASLLKKYRTVNCIDIGDGTVDLLVIRNGKPDLSVRVSDRSGMAVLRSEISNAIQQNYGIHLDSSDVEQVLMQEETILDEEIILEIQRMAENWLQRIINKLHTHVTDFRTNPAVFLGGGSLLLRKQIENSPEFKYVEFIDDVRANAIGYEKLTTARLRRG